MTETGEQAPGRRGLPLSCRRNLLRAAEWNEFEQTDYAHLKEELINPVIFDGRNIFSTNRLLRDVDCGPG